MGYKVTAVVHYDDDFKSKFGEEADTRIDAIMALVDEQFDEMKVKLTTNCCLSFGLFYQLNMIQQG